MRKSFKIELLFVGNKIKIARKKVYKKIQKLETRQPKLTNERVQIVYIKKKAQDYVYTLNEIQSKDAYGSVN